MKKLMLVLALLSLGLFDSCAMFHREPVRVEVQNVAFDVALFETCVMALSEQCPIGADFQIKVALIDGPYRGMTQWNPECCRFDIAIDGRLGMNEMIDVLIHEWAHAMVYNACHEGDTDHDAIWGVALSQAYRAVTAAVCHPLVPPVMPQ